MRQNLTWNKTDVCEVLVVELKKVYQDIRADGEFGIIIGIYCELLALVVPTIIKVNTKTIITYFVYIKDTK